MVPLLRYTYMNMCVYIHICIYIYIYVCAHAFPLFRSVHRNVVQFTVPQRGIQKGAEKGSLLGH